MAALCRRFTVIHFLVVLVSLSISSLVFGDWISDGEGEQFTEELLLKPLPDRKVLAHFHFQSTAYPSPNSGHHHHLFPKAIAQLVQKFQIRDLELSFTQGRWNYENWGGSDPISSTNAKPPGVELWATFNVPVVEIDATWKNLTHALSGLFCSSINFLESSTSYTTPRFVFGLNVSNIRYGALPREAVCTENLTPWLKLLPCRDKAGLATLLDRPSIYKGYYHSQKLRLTSTKLSGIILEQTLTVVLQPNIQRNSAHSLLDGAIQPSWSISSMFKRNLTGSCVLAKTSRILVELEKNIVSKLEELGHGGSWSNSLLDLSPNPLRVIKEVNPFPEESNSILFEYVNSKEYEPLDVGIEWKLPFVWSSPHAPFHASRFLMGSGTERGSIAISLQSTKSDEYFRNKSNGCRMQAVIFQVVPWYVKVYYHTLQIFIDRKPQNLSDVIEKMQVTPSEDKKMPGTLELVLGYPCTVQSVALTLDFDKGFLHIHEYPPDANQGFDIPSALVTFPNLHSSRIYIGDDSSVHSPLLLKFQEKNVVLSYTEVLLVPFTTPDFSMPYNVITFTCTVLALYFGSLLNVLRRRIGEEERLMRSKDASKRGLIPLIVSKITSKLRRLLSRSKPLLILAVVLAVLFHYIVN
ncbi:uncharacterized protein LOC141825455 isoform X1 [Curcuma longa]|uniref:uncharacterized protein LOC141825455 isoform X1 n=1 Tax=Curcuma longa TaxID=136217 RepID=UPI003D9F7DB3